MWYFDDDQSIESLDEALTRVRDMVARGDDYELEMFTFGRDDFVVTMDGEPCEYELTMSTVGRDLEKGLLRISLMSVLSDNVQGDEEVYVELSGWVPIHELPDMVEAWARDCRAPAAYDWQPHS